MNMLGYSVLLMLWGYSRAAQGEGCDYIRIDNGRYYWYSFDRYPDTYFPMSIEKQVSYICSDGFASEAGTTYGVTKCTSNGWSPDPECLRTCTRRYFSDVDIYYERPMYTVGTTVPYKCREGFSNPEGNESGAIDCLKDGRFSEPKCTKMAGRCGPAPPLTNGDMEGDYQQFYKTGTSVKYKCQDYHKMEGSAIVTCRNGTWTALPFCLEPCTASSEEMATHNLQLRYTDRSKLYLTHGDTVEFMCIRGYLKLETLQYRVQCNRGQLTYPTCIWSDGCFLSQEKMTEHSIQLLSDNDKTRFVGNSVKIYFRCKEGFEKHPGSGDLTQECIDGVIAYPRCIRPRTSV